MAEGTGIPGRPKGMNNAQLNICWDVLCKDLRHFPEFKVPMSNEYILYPIGNTEYIKITKIGDKQYQLLYVYNNLELRCQKLKNDNDLDAFLNKLLYEDYDFVLEGFIKQFKIKA